MEADLALDALEGVVDGLRVALQALADPLVGVAVEVERQDVALELREDARQARDEAPKLLGGDHPLGRVLAHRPGQHLLEGRFRVRGASRCLRERHVLVERRVLVAAGRLDGGDDLPSDAELREVTEARLAVRAVIPDRLVQAEQPLLYQVLRVAAQEEIRGGLEAHEAAVAPNDAVVGFGASPLREGDEVGIFQLSLRLRCWRRREGGRVGGRYGREALGGGRYGHSDPPFESEPVAPLLPRGALSLRVIVWAEARPLVHPYACE